MPVRERWFRGKRGPSKRIVLTDHVRERLNDISVHYYIRYISEDEGALLVDVDDGRMEVTEWALTEPPDDPEYMGEWEDNPVLKTYTTIYLEEALTDPDTRWRKSYSGDEGWDVYEIVRMRARDWKKTLTAIALSWMAYYGGTEEIVSSVG